MPKGIISAVVGVIVLFFLILTFGWVNIEPTDVGVEVNKIAGSISPVPMGVGYHFYNKWKTDIAVYTVSARSFPKDSMKTEHKDVWNMSLKTNDGQNVDIDMTIIYSLNAKDVPALHQTVGKNYEDQIVLPQVRSEARIAIGGYSAEDIYQGKVRDEIQKQIKQKLVENLAQYPAINIQDALMRDFAFSKEFEHAIEQKKLAAQTVEVNKNLALAAEQNAKTQEANARGEKLKVIQGAQGKGETAKIMAEAEAAAKKVNADAERYRLEQEAAGKLAIYKGEAEGKKLSADALGGGQNVVALEFAQKIAPSLQIWGIPTGQQSTSLMDLNGMFGGMFKPKEPGITFVKARE